VVVPAKTVQDAAEAGDLPQLDEDAANIFSLSERILQDLTEFSLAETRPTVTNSATLNDPIQKFFTIQISTRLSAATAISLTVTFPTLERTDKLYLSCQEHRGSPCWCCERAS
jgi:hypothetical protein